MIVTYEDLKNALRLDDLTGDPWGTAIGALLAVAEELEYARPVSVPRAWGYRPSPLGRSDNEDYICGLLVEASMDDILRFGSLLNRYCDRIRHAGRDY